jgi:hypothetical protein
LSGAIGGMYLPIRRGSPLFLGVRGFTSILGILKTGLSQEHFDGDDLPLVTVAYEGGVRSCLSKKGLDDSGTECDRGIIRMDVRHCFKLVQIVLF